MHNQSFVIREVTVLFTIFSLKIKVVNKADLRVQVKVDALVSGNVPLQWKHNTARLSQVPAQDFWILNKRTRDMQVFLYLKNKTWKIQVAYWKQDLVYILTLSHKNMSRKS